MHCVISWDIKASEPEWSALNKKMREKLSAYSWVRPLSTFYVVKIDTQQTWNTVVSDLTAICQASPQKIDFVISPLMNGGRYNGFLPKKLWDELNQRSDA